MKQAIIINTNQRVTIKVLVEFLSYLRDKKIEYKIQEIDK